jgi:hypothetical protein
MCAILWSAPIILGKRNKSIPIPKIKHQTRIIPKPLPTTTHNPNLPRQIPQTQRHPPPSNHAEVRYYTPPNRSPSTLPKNHHHRSARSPWLAHDLIISYQCSLSQQVISHRWCWLRRRRDISEWENKKKRGTPHLNRKTDGSSQLSISIIWWGESSPLVPGLGYWFIWTKYITYVCYTIMWQEINSPTFSPWLNVHHIFTKCQILYIYICMSHRDCESLHAYLKSLWKKRCCMKKRSIYNFM